ncbi:hypothetical protein GDO81_018006 [Engystomops pustulosus]|uniref:Uncharacterized protein n=1 Tax=Engystomops pustulosus TaxID=76066 RepID=A0AAV7A3V8_ENGPU|nr:hypothetical protein GDO81_018006 [Engystomops pustulosus]
MQLRAGAIISRQTAGSVSLYLSPHVPAHSTGL